MAKIRKNLVGVVHAGGLVLRAGDEIPAGVRVGGHVTDTGKPVGDEKAPVEAGIDPLTPEELEQAANLDLDVAGLHTERVRGLVEGHTVGYREGWDAAIAASDRGEIEPPVFDPSEHNAPVVLEYLEQNPDDTDRVLGLEREGKNRSGILDKF